jgi:hypothetical protein
MTWNPPPLPAQDLAAKIDYWRCLLTIPPDERGAVKLRAMAAWRLVELEALSEAEARSYLTGAEEPRPRP